jgi:YegS/Rv2252/BmrU family lipid kinase
MKNEIPFFIVNPHSGAGKTGNFFEKIRLKIEKELGPYEAVFTEGPGDGQQKALRALAGGYRRLIAVGGDGTLNEVLNGCFQRGKQIDPKIELAVFSSGSGDDFAKSIDWPLDPQRALLRLKERKIVRVDVGQVVYRGAGGEEASRYFVNIADFGLGAHVMGGVNASQKRLGAQFTYLYHTVRSLLRYQKPSVVVEIGGRILRFPEIVIGVVANGKYFGRGLCVAPEADLTDGRFNVILVERAGVIDFIRWLPRLFRGWPIEGRGIHRFETEKISVKPEKGHSVRIVTDGEQPGGLPATFQVIPKALKLCV